MLNIDSQNFFIDFTQFASDFVSTKDDEPMENEFQNLKHNVDVTMNLLNEVDMGNWRRLSEKFNLFIRLREMTFRYEDDVYKRQRAYYKMAEIWNKIEPFLLPSEPEEKNLIFNTVHLCEYPGAFIHCLVDYFTVDNRQFKWAWLASSQNNSNETIQQSIYSLQSSLRFSRLTHHNWIFGEKGTGDLFLESDSIIEEMRQRRNDEKHFADFMTCDGGIDTTLDPNNQEKLSYRLIKLELETSFQLLKDGGSLLIKMYTLFDFDSHLLLRVLYENFKTIYFLKSKISNMGSSEFYIFAHQFQPVDVNRDFSEMMGHALKNLSLRFLRSIYTNQYIRSWHRICYILTKLFLFEKKNGSRQNFDKRIDNYRQNMLTLYESEVDDTLTYLNERDFSTNIYQDIRRARKQLCDDALNCWKNFKEQLLNRLTIPDELIYWNTTFQNMYERLNIDEFETESALHGSMLPVLYADDYLHSTGILNWQFYLTYSGTLDERKSVADDASLQTFFSMITARYQSVEKPSLVGQYIVARQKKNVKDTFLEASKNIIFFGVEAETETLKHVRDMIHLTFDQRKQFISSVFCERHFFKLLNNIYELKKPLIQMELSNNSKITSDDMEQIEEILWLLLGKIVKKTICHFTTNIDSEYSVILNGPEKTISFVNGIISRIQFDIFFLLMLFYQQTNISHDIKRADCLFVVNCKYSKFGKKLVKHKNKILEIFSEIARTIDSSSGKVLMNLFSASSLFECELPHPIHFIMQLNHFLIYHLADESLSEKH
ncbi:hypothetical protein SNEBB_008765 [Seison nebaliae]|nr:hypothetical protein SNEBB_008765 [Seison nebaliae]